MQYLVIQDSQELSRYCQEAKKAAYVAVDTEFVRTRTFFPKLGLIQIYDGQQLALIDPLSVPDLEPFWQLLADEKLLKILHACSEDLEVFLTVANCRPKNLLDSQIAMAFLGHGLSLGYAAMIDFFFQIEIDKSESRTDWLKRPLTTKQLDYAAADVYYLHQITEQIISSLRDSSWLEAAFAETESLINKKFTPTLSSALYQDVKFAWRLNSAQLNRLDYLCQWRYQQAQTKDLPLSFVVKEHTMLLVAEKNPSNVGSMAQYDGIEILDVRHQGKTMLTVLQQANANDSNVFPAPLVRLDEYPGYKQIFKVLKNMVSAIAKEHNLAAEFIASKKQINQFLSWHWQLNGIALSQNSIDLLSGWRFELVGQAILKKAQRDFK